MTEELEVILDVIAETTDIADEVIEELVAEIPPPEPALDAAKTYRDELVHRPMRLDPEAGAVPDLTAEEWEWLRAYRRAERRR